MKSLPAHQKAEVDYLLLSHDPGITINELVAAFDFELIIIDHSNSYWKTKQWINECKQLGTNYYSFRDNGACGNPDIKKADIQKNTRLTTMKKKLLMNSYFLYLDLISIPDDTIIYSVIQSCWMKFIRIIFLLGYNSISFDQ